MKKISLFLVFMASMPLFGQLGNQYDIEIDGRIVADNGSDASFGTVGIDAKLFKVPFKKGRKGILTVDAQYDYVGIDYKVNSEAFEDIENLHNIGLNISYLRRINNKWSFVGILNPQLSSNFTDGVKGDDFYLNALALLNYSNTKKSRLSFGLAYTNTLGYPAPIPVVNYWKKFNKDWEMNLGFPRTNITRNLSKKSKLIGYAELKGANANISENIVNSSLNLKEAAERVSYRDIITGLEYQYSLKKFYFKVNGGYIVNRQFELQNSDGDTAYEFDMENNLNFGAGLGFNF